MIIMVRLHLVVSNTAMRALSISRDGAQKVIEINKQILEPVLQHVCYGAVLLGVPFWLSVDCYSKGTTSVTGVFKVL